MEKTDREKLKEEVDALTADQKREFLNYLYSLRNQHISEPPQPAHQSAH